MTCAASRLAATALLALVTACAASAVSAADSGRVARSRTVGFPKAVPVTISGELAVKFHGDAASGCAARGLCGYAGTVQWIPAPGWQLQVTEGLPGPGYSLVLQNGDVAPGSDFPAGGATDDDTEQPLSGEGSPGSACADSMLSGGQIELPIKRGEVTFWPGYGYPSIVQTRCPGPLITDIAAALPLATAPLHTVLRGDATIRLVGHRRFAANGFAGTVDSTLKVRLGKPYRSGTTSQLPIPKERYRVVTAGYDVAVAGATVDDVNGDAASALCEPLGACGVHGTVSVRPGVGGAGAELEAEGPARLPYRDFLAALHLNRRAPAPQSISVDGIVSWRHGETTANLSRDGISCTDSVQLDPSEMELFFRGTRLYADYFLQDSPFGDVFRTRCPGPFGPQFSVITGSVPLSDVSRRQFVLRLRGHPAAVDDGYTERISSQLALTFTRVSVSGRIVNDDVR